jgi:uncharacterized protein
MVKRTSQTAVSRRLAPALATAVAAVLAAAVAVEPAAAQFFGSPYYGQQRSYRPPPPREYSFPFFGGGGSGGGGFNPFYQPPPAPVESYKAPPPRKLETPPTATVLVIGDAMADWLAYGLEEALTDTPEIGVVRNIRPTSGLVRYDAKNDSLEWAGIIKDYLANEKPSAIVVMLGLNDRLPFRDKPPAKSGAQSGAQSGAAAQGAQPQDKSQEKLQEKSQDKSQDAPSAANNPPKPASEQPSIMAAEPQRQGPPGTYEFHTDKWAELYSKRIDDMIAALKTKGVPVLWVGLPAIYGTKSTGDMSYFDELFRARAERAGIDYIDVWDGFVDENGRYVASGPDFEGQIRRLRTGDGVHFTKAGAVKMAQYVVQNLRRLMANRAVPVALPAVPEGSGPKPGTGQRPAVGPVVPLTADTGNDGNALLGDAGRTAPTNSDPVALRVLTHGDSIAAPSGRADDFAWPRRDTGAAEAAPEPAAAAAPPPAKGAAAPKKADDVKPEMKKAGPAAPAAPATPAAPAPARRSPSAALDGGPPRPPAPVGGAPQPTATR